MSPPDASRIPTERLCIEAASPHLRREALELALGYADAPFAQSIIDRAYAQGQRDGDDWQGLLVATDATAASSPPSNATSTHATSPLLAAILVRILAGRIASVAAPQTTSDAPAGTDELLVRRAAQFAQGRDALLAQALLESNDSRAAAAFTAAAFQRTADLLFLVVQCDASPDADNHDAVPSIPQWLQYRPEVHDRFARLVERTYIDSRDCPELDGLRAIDDILAGYRATGEFSPQRWLIAENEGRDVGCLLLTDHPSDDQWELVYLGVAPEFRGRGLGLALTRHALAMTRRAGRRQLVLAVDAANEPAISIYHRAGFETWERRSIFLRRFDKPREM